MWLYGVPATAQNLESIGKEKPIAVTGGASLNQIFYSANGIESRRDPYAWYASGNINFSLYGWSVPLSFSLSNQNSSFQQPFNQYSIHPTYKWITGHFGYTSMSFSPYTVNGHIFLGGGIDLAPEGKWRFSGLYGRFLRAVEHDTATTTPPAYQRMGYGFKASYVTGKDFVDLIVFHAEDEVGSIGSLPDSLNILPQENLVVSLGGGKSFLQNFMFKAELAATAISNDTRAAESDVDHPLAKTGPLYTPRLSSSFYKAFRTSLDFQQNAYIIGVAYERIDPEYRTLGAYFFNNDLENITANGSTSILQGRMNIAVSVGTQRDNIDNTKISTMRRAVGSLNVNYAISQRINFAGSYSNFQTYTNIRSQFQQINQLTPYENLDTLNFTQLSQNATVMMSYIFGRKETHRQNVSVNLMMQDASDEQGGVPQNSGMRFYNCNTAYSLGIVPKNITLSVSVNATINRGAMIDTRTIGPVVAVSKLLFDKKLRTVFSSTYNTTYSDGDKINQVVNGRVSAILSVQKKHNINLSMVLVNRESSTAEVSRSFSEFTGTLGYSYAFGIK